MEALLGQFNHAENTLVQLVKQCLHNVPEKRPESGELLAKLQEFKAIVSEERLDDEVRRQQMFIFRMAMNYASIRRCCKQSYNSRKPNSSRSYRVEKLRLSN